MTEQYRLDFKRMALSLKTCGITPPKTMKTIYPGWVLGCAESVCGYRGGGPQIQRRTNKAGFGASTAFAPQNDLRTFGLFYAHEAGTPLWLWHATYLRVGCWPEQQIVCSSFHLCLLSERGLGGFVFCLKFSKFVRSSRTFNEK